MIGYCMWYTLKKKQNTDLSKLNIAAEAELVRCIQIIMNNSKKGTVK